jgi:putative inorganic carbon (HCO3(-)) transporter
MNNFLDTDKASVPFWGFTAMLVAMDLYHSGRGKDVQVDKSVEHRA